ncbi:MAG: hypothetical protein JST85_15055 [Acidobacteria bacterium]|nr:hypothetical protein [Acidobacteriota bacterium]
MENEPGNEEPQEGVSPVWCMVGNIVDQRSYGPGGHEQRSGTKHFRSGAKVYCFPPLWGDGYKKIKVIGHHRKSNQLVTMVILSKWVENRRAELVYSPAIIRRFDGRWDCSMRSRMLAEELAGSDFVSRRKRALVRVCLAFGLAVIVSGVIGFWRYGYVGLLLGSIFGLMAAVLVRAMLRLRN